MTQPLWLQNLAAYSLQVAVWILAGTVLVYLFQLKVPKVLLAFWQALLVLCLFLPALQSWRQVRLPAQPLSLPVIEQIGTPMVSAPVVAPGKPAPRSAPFPIYRTIVSILVGGALLRLSWLALGLLRLKRYRNKSRRLAVLPESVRDMQWRVGVSPEIFLSPDIDTPVTFGWRQPAVLFPESFAEMSECLQRPIACHELLHVERRDWRYMVLEEMVRSLFWFHPAIWWALGRVHLSREQVVDREVLKVTGERGHYLESLLHIASLRGRPAAVPAPLLLKERHLVQRVALMLKEYTMSKTRLTISLAAIAAFLFWTGTFAAAWFPLTAPSQPEKPAQAENHAIPDSRHVSLPGDQIMISYENASLSDFIHAVASMLEITPIEIEASVNGRVTFRSQTPISKEELFRVFTGILKENHAELVKSGDGYKVVRLQPATQPAPAANRATQAPKREPLRVGGNVQESRVIYKVDPVYPELAKRVHLESVVILEALVNEQGEVANVRVIRGHPLLDQAAMEAVKQWRYAQTLLNGEAVPVITTVTVIFKLGNDTATGASTAQAPTAGAVRAPQREPMRVGGNILDGKLIARVEPVYPELARRARVEAVVILEVSVNEQGEVANVRVIRGHPLLDQAAVEAVKQWRYSPTFLNGEAVPVLATQTVVFKLNDLVSETRVLINQDGSLRDLENHPISLEELKNSAVTVQIPTPSPASLDTIERTLRSMEDRGIRNFRLVAPAYVYRDGRLYYRMLYDASSRNSQAAGIDQSVQAPILDINMDRLAAMAKASGRINLPQGQGTAVLYTVFVNERGGIVAVEHVPSQYWPEIPEITTLLSQTRIAAPGRRGNEPVPTAVSVTVLVPPLK